MAVLRRHHWPGNVRELENVIYRSAVIAQGHAILVKDLPLEIQGAVTAEPSTDGSEAPFDQARTAGAESAALAAAKLTAASAAAAEPALTVSRALDFLHTEFARSDEPMLPRLELELIRRVLAAEGGDAARAAARLGLTRAALQKKFKKV
jgi:two-component system nitrogen regulation response regulator GlnG